jgi:hypothetical protein
MPVRLLLVAFLVGFAFPQDKEMGEARKYKILFAGKRGSDREKKFVQLLLPKFGRVDAISLEQLDSRAAAPYDVVVADWDRRWAHGDYQDKKPRVQLDDAFSKPIVMVGAIAGEIQKRSKIASFELGLMNEAHGMRLDHPIFKGPLEPKLETAVVPTPERYRKGPQGKDLPAELETWVVQNGRVTKDIDYGLVTSPLGFEDSPDAESISGGSNTRAGRAPALARHGNFFLWGFAGDPSQMTESARRVFVNAICYMKRFDGRRPIAPMVSVSREMAFIYVQWLRDTPGPKVPDWVLKTFPPEVRDETDLKPDRMDAWYKANLEWLCPAGDGIGADPDLRALKVPNRTPAFWDAVLARLAKDEKDEVAWRLVGRCHGRTLKTATEVRAWVEENRPYLFFTDVGGFRWFVDEHAKREAAGKGK